MRLERFMSRREHLHSLGAMACGIGWPLVTGCGDFQPKGFEEVRRQVLVEQLPQQVSSLADAYASFEEGKQVAVIGRIFSSLGSPFDRETAAFNLIELPKPGHKHDDPGDCPFCKHEMENAANALVQIVGAAGEVLQPSADKLLGLSKNQDVVVEGTVSKVGEIMLIHARSVHVVSPESSADFAKRFHG